MVDSAFSNYAGKYKTLHKKFLVSGYGLGLGLIVVDTGYGGIHLSKYWMPIQYDTIEDGQNKKYHLLFSKYKVFVKNRVFKIATHH